MLNSIITTNGFLNKYQVSKLVSRHGYTTWTPVSLQWRKKKVQQHFIASSKQFCVTEVIKL